MGWCINSHSVRCGCSHWYSWRKCRVSGWSSHICFLATTSCKCCELLALPSLVHVKCLWFFYTIQSGITLYGPRQANLVLIAYASSEGSGEPAHPRSLPESSLLAHTSSELRGTFRQKARSLAPLNDWACAVEICHDGMLEDTNSLDGAHIHNESQVIRNNALKSGTLRAFRFTSIFITNVKNVET